MKGVPDLDRGAANGIDRGARLSVALVVGLFALRFGLVGAVGLGDDEAYYWAWSRRPDWGYFDHPPMIAWLIALSTRLGGNGEGWVRAPALALSIGVSLLLALLARRLWPRERGIASRAVLVANLIPLLSIGSVFVLPDLPLAFFWVLGALLAWEAGRREGWFWWTATGVVGGLGLLSKYHMILFAASVFLWLATSPERRRWLARPQPYVAFLLMLALFLPVVVWNARHDWVSFRFQFYGRHGGEIRPWTHLGQFLGSQVGLVSPLLWPASLWALGEAWKRGRAGDETERFLFWISGFVILFFALTCPFTDFKPHWSGVGYLTACLLVVRWARRRRPPFVRTALALAAFMGGLLYVQGVYPVVQKAASALRLPSLPEGADLTHELYGWDRAAERIERDYSRLAAEGPAFVFAHMYQNAAQAEYAVKGRLPVVRLGDRRDEYSIWQGERGLPPPGSSALFVCHSKYFLDPRGAFPFEACAEQPPLEILRSGVHARTFHFWVCRGFRGASAPPR